MPSSAKQQAQPGVRRRLPRRAPSTRIVRGKAGTFPMGRHWAELSVGRQGRGVGKKPESSAQLGPKNGAWGACTPGWVQQQANGDHPRGRAVALLWPGGMLVQLSWTHLRLLLVVGVGGLLAPRALDRLAVHVRIVRGNDGVRCSLLRAKPAQGQSGRCNNCGRSLKSPPRNQLANRGQFAAASPSCRRQWKEFTPKAMGEQMTKTGDTWCTLPN